MEMRKYVMCKHAHRPFAKRDPGFAAWIFRGCGYCAVDMIKDMDSRDRELILAPAVRGGRSALADLRRALKICAQCEHANLPDVRHPPRD